MIGDRGPKKAYSYEGDGCCTTGEKKTFCIACIFQHNCPKQAINDEKSTSWPELIGIKMPKPKFLSFLLRQEIKNLLEEIMENDDLKDVRFMRFTWIMVCLFLASFWSAVAYPCISNGELSEKILVGMGLFLVSGLLMFLIILRVKDTS